MLKKLLVALSTSEVGTPDKGMYNPLVTKGEVRPAL
jgi:hypothetical protein